MKPKCKCGNRMKEGNFTLDMLGNRMYECACGMLMKRVPLGNPEKNSYMFFILLSFFFTKKKWLTPYPVKS